MDGGNVKLDSVPEALAELLPLFRIEKREGLVCPRCGEFGSPGVLVRPIGELPMLCAGCFVDDVNEAAKQSAGVGWNVKRPEKIDGERFKKAYKKACDWYRKPVDGAVSQEFYNDLNGVLTTLEMEVGFRRAQARHEYFPTSQQVRDAGRAKL